MGRRTGKPASGVEVKSVKVKKELLYIVSVNFKLMLFKFSLLNFYTFNF